MDILTFIVVGAIGGAVLYGIFQSKPTQQDGGRPPPPQPLSAPLKTAHERLSKILADCQADHHEAASALLWLAGSDGTVSRQELRIIIGFCERQGARVEKSWGSALDFLNSGLNISVTGGEGGAMANITDLRSKPMSYRIAFVGAVEAIIAANKTSNSAKRRLADAARMLVDS